MTTREDLERLHVAVGRPGGEGGVGCLGERVVIDDDELLPL